MGCEKMLSSKKPAISAPVTAMMQPDQIDFYRSHLASSTGGLIEFGVGGSTLIAIASPVPLIHSVESDRAWVAKLRQHPEVAQAEKSGRLRFHGDIGWTRRLGFPRTSWSARKWPNYYLRVWDSVLPEQIDTVFIDGRFRLACGLTALTKATSETTIMIHDFWKRPHYHQILAFADEVARVGSLAVLRRKQQTDWPSLPLTLAEAMFDPR